MDNLGMSELIAIIAAVALFAAVFTVVPYWFIIKKAGFHPALSLLMIVPIANIVLRFYLAFAPWPSLKKSED